MVFCVAKQHQNQSSNTGAEERWEDIQRKVDNITILHIRNEWWDESELSPRVTQKFRPISEKKRTVLLGPTSTVKSVAWTASAEARATAAKEKSIVKRCRCLRSTGCRRRKCTLK